MENKVLESSNISDISVKSLLLLNKAQIRVKLETFSDNELNELTNIIRQKYDDINYVISATLDCRTMVQKVVGIVTVDFDNVAKLRFEFKKLAELIEMVDYEREIRGMISVVRVGVDWSSKNLTISSGEGFVSRPFDPKTDSPEKIMAEAVEIA
ncbi:MAG: hypothetical protein ABID64_00530 [Nitrospirota bacterium]